jgi:nitrogen regulation protein NR(I)
VGKILIIDDDSQLRQSFGRLLIQDGHDISNASTAEAGLEIIASEPLDLVIMDVRLPGMSGLHALQEIQEIDPKLPVIVMTAYGSTDTAIEATKMGAFDYILKPFDIPEMLALIAQALEAGRMMRSRVELGSTQARPVSDALVGSSKVMQEIYKAIGRVAPTDATVLIRGESGTGKELVARAVYQHSLRANSPFQVINCVAIPETLLESELFGYEKGAFTGAFNRKIGKIEQAEGGTVFLDEIGDMPFSIQSKILRLLQEKSIERIGGRQPQHVDVRVVAATNRNLEEELEQGVFREDLYYRLKVVTIWLPPLRDRRADIPVLADYFLDVHAHAMEMQNPGISEEAKRVLEEYHWPGNVRELSNTIQKALIFSRGYSLNGEDIRKSLAATGAEGPTSKAEEQMVREYIRTALASEHDETLYNSLLERFSNMIVGEALVATNNNRSRAAKLLGLSRPTLLSKIEKHGLKLETQIKE